jgi:hypothetical protein
VAQFFEMRFQYADAFGGGSEAHEVQAGQARVFDFFGFDVRIEPINVIVLLTDVIVL